MIEESFKSSVLTVTQLTKTIKSILETTFGTIQLKGEITNWRPASSGHIYFSLRDANASIQAVIFRREAARIGFNPKEGEKVEVSGRISLYEQRGQYQIICISIKKVGKGNLLAELQERKEKLEKEGLFKPEIKKEIPHYPKKIAIISSPTGAALQDILRVMSRREGRIDVVILPTAVQGINAAKDISSQIAIANKFNMADIIVVARGGGSLEDLLPFSEEIVVRAIFNSTIPVVTGIGHEIDTSLADLAADLRCATPSAAAELITNEKEQIYINIKNFKSRIKNAIESRIELLKSKLSRQTKDEWNRRWYRYIEPVYIRFDDIKEKSINSIEQRLKLENHRLLLLKQRLISASPIEIMKRGYSFISRKDGSVVKSSKELKHNDKIEIRMHDGRVEAEVKEVKNEF